MLQSHGKLPLARGHNHKYNISSISSEWTVMPFAFGFLQPAYK